MAEPDDAELLRDLARLRQKYRRRLPAQITALAQLLAAAREAGERESLEGARGLTHRLRGTSGSYGLDAISAELRRIEDVLDRPLDGRTPAGVACWREVERALARIRAELAIPGVGYPGHRGGTA